MKIYSLTNTLFLFFSGWGILALLLAWSGILYAPIFFVYTVLFIGALLTLSPKKRGIPHSIHQGSILSRIIAWNNPYAHICFLALLALFLTSFFQPATFFSGRDEGSLFQASFELAHTHSLTFSSPESRAFFEIYGQGRALNFPGFYYTENGDLTTQFPTAYISWLASFMTIFGIPGIVLANAVLLFLFFLALEQIIRSFASSHWAIIGTLLTVTSFPIFWFSRFTLTENFALAFVWIFILTVYRLTTKPKRELLVLLLFSGILVLFGRIEGFAFVLIALAILFQSKDSRAFLLSDKKRYILAPTLILSLLSIFSVYINTPFYITVAKGFLQGSSETAFESSLFLSSLADRWHIFSLYGIGPSLLIGLLGIVLLTKKKFSPKILTLSIAIIFPSFLYFFISFISPDHPWMLRRFMFSITPLALILCVFVCAYLFKLHKKYLGTSLVALLFLMQLPALVYFFPLSQGNDLLIKARDIAQFIPEGELLLVDQLASGDGFRMFPGAISTLFNTRAVYFMNPYDLDELDLSHFSSISLLVPEGREDLYTPILRENNAEKIFSLPLAVSALEYASITFRQFPKRIITKQNVLLYRWTVSP